jgi:hypothetical protein
MIGHKHGKEIYLIERYVVNELSKGIISCLWVHADARLDVGEKSIIFRSVTFQNLVHNSYNVRLERTYRWTSPGISIRPDRLTPSITE